MSLEHPTKHTTTRRVHQRGCIRKSYGGHSERETPGPIPNPEVKPFSADGTATERLWESRTPPDILSNRATPSGVALFRISGHVSCTVAPTHRFSTAGSAPSTHCRRRSGSSSVEVMCMPAQQKSQAAVDPAVNEVRLVGRVSRTPEERVLPSGDVLWTFRVVVPRAGASGRPAVDALECA